MKSSIRIIKRKQGEDESDFQIPGRKQPAERQPRESTREMVSNVKSWIAELKQRRTSERRSFSPFAGRGPESGPLTTRSRR
jgi:hypothetical protein